MMEFTVEPGVEKIAVLRANSLGDFIVTLPALAALKATYPDAELTLLGLPWHLDFLRGRPGPVDRVTPIPRAPGLPVEDNELRPDERVRLEAFFQRMRRERFDLAIQLHGGGRHSNPFVASLGARLTAGRKTPDAAPLDRWIGYVYEQHEVMKPIETVSLVGAHPVGIHPRVHVTDSDLVEACTVLGAHGVDVGRPLVAIHPGATDPRRRWPPERFAEVGSALWDRGLQVAVIGVVSEAEIVARVLDGLVGRAVDLTGRLSVGGLAGLLSIASLLVCNDSGPHHLGMAVGTPSVAVYWCGNLVNAGPLRTGAHRVLTSWRLDCPRCGVDCTKGRCEHRDSFVADVRTEDVLASAIELVELAPQHLDV